MPSELNFKPAYELAEAIRSKQLSPVELMQACFDRIDETNETLNAWTGMPHRDDLPPHAPEIGHRVPQGGDVGPLAGLGSIGARPYPLRRPHSRCQVVAVRSRLSTFGRCRSRAW